MKCRHELETLQQTIKAGMIVADVCRCTKCGAIRRTMTAEPGSAPLATTCATPIEEQS